MKIVYFGNNQRGVKCLEALCDAGFHVSTVIVHYGASDEPNPSSVRYTAEVLGIPVHDPQNVNSPEFIAELNAIKPDLMILSGYNQILRKGILRIPSKGTINLHGGRLPFYRGGSPINWQIISGETSGGCAIIYVDEGIDTGDIIAQEFYEILPDDTAGDVTNKTLEIFPRLLIDIVKKIQDNSVKTVKQDLSVGAYYCKRYPSDGRILWDKMSFTQVHNLVRGLNGPGLPGAFTYLDGKKIIIWRTKLLNTTVKGVPGRVALKYEDGVVVIAKDRGILVTEIKLDADQNVLRAREYFKICGLTFE